MLQVFYANIAKVDVAMLRCVLSACYIFDERFECSMQHETDVAADFFSHHQRMTNNFFQYNF